jgi:PPK2 family polyphosphate:nucleotide phosphotransferase
MSKHIFEAKKFRVKEGESIKLSKIATKAGNELSKKSDGENELKEDSLVLQEMQNRLFASGQRSLLIILQGMDASGKDGTVRHVMNGVNPQGCRIYGFRAPTSEDVQHHFLWRPMRYLPARGMISIFNRSYYEEVIVVRVHPEFLGPQNLPAYKKPMDLWKQRYKEIRTFEQTLVDSGTSVLKFFLHISRDEQKTRLMERMTNPEKRWKFNEHDLEERKLWETYEEAIEDALPATSSKTTPWYIIPADDKWYARAAVADIIAAHVESLDLKYPNMSPEDDAKYALLAKQFEEQ